MKNVVITGSTRGIGFGLADAFLARGCGVMVSGRSEQAVAQAIIKLKEKYPQGHIHGNPCDVREADQVQDLWDIAHSHFNQIDIWINNAGISAPQQLIQDCLPAQVEDVFNTNLLGLIYGSQVALRGMLTQGHGVIYNMEGAGSDGKLHDRLILYGTSKYAIRYFTRGLVKETTGSPVIVASIRPGMVITEFITSQFEDRPQEWQRVKPIFNIIADRVETVAPWLAERILENKKHGAIITRVSRLKLMWRFLSAPLVKRDIFTEEQD